MVGQGAMPPEPWIKKVKLSCSIMHIDALAVAVINDHKNRDIAIISLWGGGLSH